jgi:hypothetical protein
MLLIQNNPKGSARTKDDVSHSSADSSQVAFGPKKAFAPGIKGQEAPA